MECTTTMPLHSPCPYCHKHAIVFNQRFLRFGSTHPVCYCDTLIGGCGADLSREQPLLVAYA